VDWNEIRKLVPLDPTVVMLNTGSFGPTPTPVMEYTHRLRLRLAEGPTNFFLRETPPLLWDARVRTARFLGTTPQRLIFTTNVSVSINIIAQSLTLASGGELLMSDHEYGAMIWTWERAAQRLGLTIKTFPVPLNPTDPAEIVEAAKKAITPKTRMLFCSHVLAPHGLIMPAKELCALARKHGVLSVIDGAHAAAMIDLNITEVGADFYAGNLHKWLLAPIGSGFLVFGPGQEDKLQPMWISWGYRPDHEYMPGAPKIGPDDRDRYGSTPRIRAIEFDGTRDVCAWMGVPEAIEFQEKIGWSAIRNQHRELAKYTIKSISERFGFPLATPDDTRFSGSMTAVVLPAGSNADRWRQELWKRRIEIPVNERAGRVMLRVSHHFYTREADIDALAVAIAEVMKEVGM
jgi:isopenicillin-N epimerase